MSGLKPIGVAIRAYQNSKGEIAEDRRYYITNLYYEYIDLISKWIRGELVVENKLYRYLDVVFKEDANVSFLKNTQNNLNIVRKFCLNILKLFEE